MTFADAVRAEIERRGMPLAVLARRADVSRQTIYTLLSGENVSAAVRERVARELSIEAAGAAVS